MLSNNDDVGNTDNGLSLSPSGQLDLLLSDKDVEDALNFDLDFDTMAETMGDALPNINLDDMGSLGTRSPSPSASASGTSSVFSKGSKRSRAEFDSESECSSMNGKNKRMVFASEIGGYDMTQTDGSGIHLDQQEDSRQGQSQNSGKQGGLTNSPTKVIKKDREREGRCPDCGLDTHRIFMNDNGFELQPLTIEGEVLNGRCLLCNPLKEGENVVSETTIQPSGSQKKGGRRKESNKKSLSSRKSDTGNKPPEQMSASKNKQSPRPPSRGMSAGSGFSVGSNNMGSPAAQAQQRKMMRMHSTQGGGNLPFPPPPPAREGRRSAKPNPTPSQYHSKMALLKQAKLPRKHSARQHALLAFGNTNNRGAGRKQNSGRRSSNGSGFGKSSGQWDPQRNSSNNSLSSVSCSEAESAHVGVQHIGNDGDDNFSKVSGFSQNSVGGGLKNAMAMGMGMQCTEMASVDPHTGMSQQQQPVRPTSRNSNGPQTPHSQRRSPSDPPLYRSASTSVTQTPQSVPNNPSNIMSNRVPTQAPQSVPSNMNNMLSSRVGGGVGDQRNQQQQSPSQSLMSSNMHKNNSSSKDLSKLMGNVPQAVRTAHSKLQSSIYHHHIYPLNDETEHAHIEKTLEYLESGTGDIADIIVAMRRFPFCLAIQSVSCEKLYHHCFDQEHASAIGLVGGIRTIIDAMEHHPEDVALQRGCAGMIKHLATASTYNLDMLDRMGAVSIIVDTMERHPKNAPLLESACWAMESMSRSKNSEIKRRLAKGGGIHAAMKAVETFPNNESLLRAAFHCLRRLGYNPSNYNSSQGGPGQGGMQKLQQRMKQQQQGQTKQHSQQQMQQQQQQQQMQMQQQQQQMQHQHQARQQHVSNSQQQSQQQVPSFILHRGSVGSGVGNGGMQRGGSGGAMMAPNNMSPMMGGSNNQMSNMPNNNPMMGNSNQMMGGNNPMMGGNNSMMGGNNNMMGGNLMMGNTGHNHMMGNSSNNSGNRGRM